MQATGGRSLPGCGNLLHIHGRRDEVASPAYINSIRMSVCLSVCLCVCLCVAILLLNEKRNRHAVFAIRSQILPRRSGFSFGVRPATIPDTSVRKHDFPAENEVILTKIGQL